MTDYTASIYADTEVYGEEILGYLGARKESVISDRMAIMEDAPRSVEGMSPEIDSVTVLSSTSIKITFLYAAIDNAALRAGQNYLISPSLDVVTVTPEAITYPTYVILTVSEQKQGESYSVTLQRIARAT